VFEPHCSHKYFLVVRKALSPILSCFPHFAHATRLGLRLDLFCLRLAWLKDDAVMVVLRMAD